MTQSPDRGACVRFGVFELDLRAGELRKSGRTIRLQEQPFQILEMLVEHQGEVVTREELKKKLWADQTIVEFDHSINAAVKRLRDALGDSADTPRYVETLPRRGYRLVAPVERVPSIAAGQPVVVSIPASDEPAVHHAALLPRRRLLSWVVAGCVAGAVVVALWRLGRSSPERPIVTRFTISLSPSDRFEMARGGLAISPEGTNLVYSATPSRSGTRQLYLRAMDRHEAIPIPGTEGAFGPFFSPDGRWVAFSAEGLLKKIPLRGGTPIVLCARVNPSTGSWGADGTIVFTDGSGPSGNENGKLMRILATGGTAQMVAPADSTEFAPRWPETLPGGDAILYVTGGTSTAFSDDATVVAQSLKTGERKILIRGGTSPRYVSTGHIVYAQGGRLLAVPFDLRSLEVTGASFPVADDIWQGPGGYAAYDISSSGSLVYLTRGEDNVRDRTLNWVDRAGATHSINATARQYSQPNLSPDGRHLAVVIGDPMRHSDIWVLDSERNTMAQLTFSTAGETALAPVWTPDGRRLLYAAGRQAASLFSQPVEGPGAAELLFSSDVTILPAAVSPDGRLLVLQRGDVRHFDFWTFSLSGAHEARPLLESSSTKTQAQISPDGRWLAYTSTESGRPDVYAQPFPGMSEKWRVSLDGGDEPRWSRDGRLLFFRRGETMMAVDIQQGRSFNPGTRHLLFQGPYVTSSLGTDYDVAPDGQRFLMLKEDGDMQARQMLRVVLNWTEELKTLAPGGDLTVR